MRPTVCIIIFIIVSSLAITSCGQSESDTDNGSTDNGSTTTGLWVATDGSDSNPGTISQPFRTISKAIETVSSANRNIRLVGGTYSETTGLTLSDGISIYGGYGPLESGTRQRDVDAYATTVDFSNCTDSYCYIRVNESTTGTETTIDGLTVTGIAYGVMIVDSSPTINNCTVSSTGGSDREYGIFMAAYAGKQISPVVSSSIIASGDSWVDDGRSHGIAFYTYEGSAKISPVVRDNTITSGRAKHMSWGITGSADAASEANLTASGNTIRSGISGNDSTGIYLGSSGSQTFNDATLEANTIIAGEIQEATELTTDTYAIQAVDIGGSFTATNNFIYSGENGTWSGGINLMDVSDASIYCNSIVVGSGTGGVWDIILHYEIDVDIEDNILCPSSQTTSGIGVYVSNDVTSATPVSALKNNLFCTGLETLYDDYSGGGHTACSDVGAVNAINSTFSDNISGAASFVDAADYDYHITADSDAIVHGLTLSACSTDIDGQARPNGAAPDIGADEYY